MATLTINLVAADGATDSITATVPTVNDPQAPESYYAASVVPTTPINKDQPLTIGMAFTVAVSGAVTAIRCYKGALDTGDIAALYDQSTGNLLSQANATETTVGWQQVSLPQPFQLNAGTTYIAAWFTNGTYAADANKFTAVTTQNGITVPASGGIFTYAASLSMPTLNYQATSYYVDVVFVPGETGQQEPPPPPAGPLTVAVFSPWNPTTNAVDYPYYEGLLGMPANTLVDMGHGLAFQGSWADYENSAPSVVSMWNSEGRGNGLVQCTLPPFPDGVSGTLTQAATGAYNSHYTTIAQTFVNNGFTKVLFRPAWEFEGNWYPWGWESGGTYGGLQNQATYATDYIGTFQQMVTTIRAVMPDAVFCFCCADGTIMPNWQSCYPGDAYCDIIGMDSYDGNRSSTTPPSARWAQDQEPGITASQALAVAHKKGWGVFEWGVGAKLGDNPLFVQNMALACQTFIANGLPCYTGLWDADTWWLGSYPNSLAQFETAFPNGFHEPY